MRATGEEHRSLRTHRGNASDSEQHKPPAFEELQRLIGEEQSNRLNPMDGYHKPPPKPREGFGLQLRSQFDDINEYFVPPQWHDQRAPAEADTQHDPRFAESAEARGLTPPLGPWVGRKRKPSVGFPDEGKVVRRPEPPRSQPPPEAERKVFKAKIRFRAYRRWDLWRDKPAEFADIEEARKDINYVAKILHDHPAARVKIRASVGAEFSLAFFTLTRSEIERIKKKRGDAVRQQLEAQGTDPSRIEFESGSDGVGPENRLVEFVFDQPVL